MATIDELRARAELIAEEQQIGGNTAERVGEAFDMVADIIEAVAPGDEQAVLYNPQSPNESQKAQARANIGAQEAIPDIADYVKVSAQTFTAAQKQQARENIGAEQAGGTVKNLAGSASDTETRIKAANNPNLQANINLSGNNIYVNGIAGGIDLDNSGVNIKAGNSGYPNASVKVNGEEVATKLYVDGKVDDRATSIEDALALIEAVIPSQASAQNKLADKTFVNSSISSSTANFVGTFNSLAELQAVQNPTNNDYGFVIETDAVGNEYYDRYKFNGTEWLFEYKVESTPFTAAQWAAIQSGITSALVTKLSALPTNTELTTSLNAKADKSDTYTKAQVDAAIAAIDVSSQIAGKADKVANATNGDFAALDANGNLTDSGKKSADFATAEQGAKADAAAPQSNTYTKAEVNNLIVPASTTIQVVGSLPATGTANTIYRVAGDPNTASYTDYGWDGTQFVPLAVNSNTAAVLTDPQVLTDAQKEQAQDNIGLNLYSKNSGVELNDTAIPTSNTFFNLSRPISASSGESIQFNVINKDVTPNANLVLYLWEGTSYVSNAVTLSSQADVSFTLTRDAVVNRISIRGTAACTVSLTLTHVISVGDITLLQERVNDVDEYPTFGSDKLVSSSGIAEDIGILARGIYNMRTRLFTSSDIPAGEKVYIKVGNGLPNGTALGTMAGVGLYDANDTRIAVVGFSGHSELYFVEQEIELPSNYAYCATTDWINYNYVYIRAGLAALAPELEGLTSDLDAIDARVKQLESSTKRIDGVIVGEGVYNQLTRLFDSSVVSVGDSVTIDISNEKDGGYNANCGMGYYKADGTRISVAAAFTNATELGRKSVSTIIPEEFDYAAVLNWSAYLKIYSVKVDNHSLVTADDAMALAKQLAENGNIPSYYEALANEAFDRITRYRAGDSKIVFPIFTDLHADAGNDAASLLHLRYACMLRSIGFSFIANLGDIGVDVAYTNGGIDELNSRLCAYADAQGQSDAPVLFTKGNHECYINDSAYDLGVLREYVQAPFARRFPIHIVDGRMYGYYDIDSRSCRVIFLDSFDGGNALSGSGFTEQQLIWVRDILLSTPSGYSVIFLDHLFPDYRGQWKINEGGTYRDPTANDFPYPTASLLVKMLQDYIARESSSVSDSGFSISGVSDFSWDFSGAGAYIVGMFCGHSHFDYEVKEGGLNLILSQSYGSASTSTEIPSWGRFNSFDRTSNANIDVVCVDPSAREFKIVRMGVGGESADRMFTY